VKILITGGLGYLGGRLAQYLTQQGHDLVLSTRHPQATPWLPHAVIKTVDWSSIDSLAAICDGVDVVIHTAGLNAQTCKENPDYAYEFNVLATQRLLAGAEQAKSVQRLLYFSTAHVYGNNLIGQVTESTKTAAAHPYAITKLAAEEYLLEHNKQVETIVIRLSNAYGWPVQIDTDCWTLLVNDLARQAVAYKAMTLQTSGLQFRDFIPLQDVNLAVEHLLLLDEQALGARLFNLGGEWTSTVFDMARLIQDRCKLVLGYEPLLNRAVAKAGEDYASFTYNISALQSTGFQLASDQVSEIDGLLKIIKANLLS
jgi:UDP-glucose 4-epimerase